MKRIAVVAIAVALAGCGPEPTMGMGVTSTVPNSWESNPRFSVSRVGVFKDVLIVFEEMRPTGWKMVDPWLKALDNEVWTINRSL